MYNWHRGEKIWQVSFLHTYSITMFLGILCSFLSICYFWKLMKYSWEVLYIMLIIIVPTSIIGARLWFLIWEGDWSQWWVLSGLSIHGGVFVSTACVIPYVLYAQRQGLVNFRIVLSIVLSNVILGQAIGRWGNFANHEVYGAVVTDPSTLDWLGAIKSHMYIDSAYRQPLFLYEFLTSSTGYIVLVLILLRKNWLQPGVVGSCYLIWYGTVRLAMEPVRDKQEIMGDSIGFPISIFVAALSLTGGVWLFIYWQWLGPWMHKKIVALNKTSGFFKLARRIINPQTYEQIMPVKPKHKYIFWGKIQEDHKKYLLFGPRIPNTVRIWIPKQIERRWSKREINQGAQRSE